MVYRVFLADDEPLICSELRYILEQEDDVEVAGECFTGGRVLESIKKLKPHLMFLDINMPGISGIDIARALVDENNAPLIVFVTAYEEYAIEAFKVNAVGYILKPFAVDDVKSAMKQIRKRFRQRNEYIQDISRTLEMLQQPRFKRIQGEKDGKLCLIDPEEIHVIVIRDRICYILTTDSEYTTNQPISTLEGRLAERHFFRCHRNYLVNLKKVKEVIPWFNGTYLLVVKPKNKMEVPVSRYRIKEFKALVDL